MALDGLRGVAIILVLLLHFFPFYPFSYFSSFGWIGVDLFFVISGFLITGILYDTKREKSFYRNFIIRRVLRIFPLYYLVLAIFFLIDKLSFLPEYKYYPYSQLTLWTYTSNINMAIYGAAKSGLRVYLEHFWSLAIEEQFYLFWPFCIMLFRTKNIIRISVLFVLFSVILKNLHPDYPFSYFFTFSRLEGLLIGALIAILIRKNKQVLEKLVFPVLIFSSIAILVTIITKRSMSNGDICFIRYGYTLIDLFFGCILTLSFATSWLGKAINLLLKSKILTFFGKYSYGIYVYHWILFSILHTQLENVPSYQSDSFITKIIMSVSCLVMTICLSLFSYHYYESVFLELKSRFTSSREVT